MPKLANAKRERFCQEFIIDLNGKQAAIRSEYSEKTAEQQASRLLSNAKVQQRIAELKEIRSERTRVTQDLVLQELMILAKSDFRDYGEIVKDFAHPDGRLKLKAFKDMKGDVTRAIKSISEHITKDGIQLKFKLHNKLPALELLAKHLGMLIERHEITGDEGGPIKIEYVLVEAKKGGDGDGKENLEGKAPAEATETAGEERPK